MYFIRVRFAKHLGIGLWGFEKVGSQGMSSSKVFHIAPQEKMSVLFFGNGLLLVLVQNLTPCQTSGGKFSCHTRSFVKKVSVVDR